MTARLTSSPSDALGAALELAQDQRRDLGRGQRLLAADAVLEHDAERAVGVGEAMLTAVVGVDVLHAQAHEALDREDRAQRVECGAAACAVADQEGPVGRAATPPTAAAARRSADPAGSRGRSSRMTAIRLLVVPRSIPTIRATSSLECALQVAIERPQVGELREQRLELAQRRSAALVSGGRCRIADRPATQELLPAPCARARGAPPARAASRRSSLRRPRPTPLRASAQLARASPARRTRSAARRGGT